MFNIQTEKTKSLQGAGSFYYKNVSDASRKVTNDLSRIPFQTTLFEDLNNIVNLQFQKCYIKKLDKILEFKDEDVGYYAMKKSIQDFQSVFIQGFVPSTENEEALTDEEDNMLVSLSNEQDIIKLGPSYTLVFKLKIPENMLILAVSDIHDNLLANNIDFFSEFGTMWLSINPTQLFPGNKVKIQQYLERISNIFCYPLGIDPIYGDVDHIIKYFRYVQSPKQFKLACSQAIGLPVVKQEATIIKKINLKTGCAYIMSDGNIYDAAFDHNFIKNGTLLQKNQIIGEELVKIILPTDEVPQEIQNIQLGNSCIVPGIIIPNRDITIYQENGLFKPEYEGDRLSEYYSYIEGDPYYKSESEPNIQNGVDHFRNIVAKNRCIIIHIDKKNISNNMQHSLIRFIKNNSPVGSVIVYSFIA